MTWDWYFVSLPSASQNVTVPLGLVISGGAPPPRRPRPPKDSCAFAPSVGQVAGDLVTVHFQVARRADEARRFDRRGLEILRLRGRSFRDRQNRRRHRCIASAAVCQPLSVLTAALVPLSTNFAGIVAEAHGHRRVAVLLGFAVRRDRAGMANRRPCPPWFAMCNWPKRRARWRRLSRHPWAGSAARSGPAARTIMPNKIFFFITIGFDWFQFWEPSEPGMTRRAKSIQKSLFLLPESAILRAK